ncbi:DNA-binding protein [Bacillus sp. 2205SS5-2]|uniref:DNA-binding protein n=1 Tax=Bacillus sp. 2205SS5-2 TaxID=3109031 RepID=UPI003005DCE9
MEWDFILIATGIAAAGYFIGDGLKNFKNPNAKNLIDSLNEDDEHELLKENDVHHFMGISKEDAKSLIQEHTDIPHIIINNKVYYPKEKLRNWLLNLGEGT